MYSLLIICFPRQTMSLAVSDPNAPALALFGKARAAVLSALFRQEGDAKHLRQIAREGSIGPTALARELDAFLAAGVLIEKRVGNLRLFQANPQSPFNEPFRQLAAALSLSARPASEAPARDDGGVPKTRKSQRLGLSAPYDWPNPDIPDDALIAKAGFRCALRISRRCAPITAWIGFDRYWRKAPGRSGEKDSRSPTEEY